MDHPGEVSSLWSGQQLGVMHISPKSQLGCSLTAYKLDPGLEHSASLSSTSMFPDGLGSQGWFFEESGREATLEHFLSILSDQTWAEMETGNLGVEKLLGLNS